MDLCFKLIVLVQVIEVVFNLLVGLLNEGVELAFREVPAPTVYGFELAAVDTCTCAASAGVAMSSPPNRSHSRQKRVKERQTFWIALPKVLASVIVPAKIGDGLKVRSEAAQKPHQFHVAVGLLLQPAA